MYNPQTSAGFCKQNLNTLPPRHDPQGSRTGTTARARCMLKSVQVHHMLLMRQSTAVSVCVFLCACVSFSRFRCLCRSFICLCPCF